jgi:hypothetical protein
MSSPETVQAALAALVPDAVTAHQQGTRVEVAMRIRPECCPGHGDPGPNWDTVIDGHITGTGTAKDCPGCGRPSANWIELGSKDLAETADSDLPGAIVDMVNEISRWHRHTIDDAADAITGQLLTDLRAAYARTAAGEPLDTVTTGTATEPGIWVNGDGLLAAWAPAPAEAIDRHRIEVVLELADRTAA